MESSRAKNSYIFIRGNTGPALCIMFGFVRDDWSQSPHSAGPSRVAKMLSVVPHSLEIEWKIATICVLTNTSHYHAHIDEKGLVYTTRPGDDPCKCNQPCSVKQRLICPIELAPPPASSPGINKYLVPTKAVTGKNKTLSTLGVNDDGMILSLVVKYFC